MDLDEDGSGASTSSNLSNSWWNEISEEENSALPFDSSEGGLWFGDFVPPPPRPIFIDDNVATDGLTTCDLCTWAWKNSNGFSLDAALAPGEIGWVLTMVIVSLISAAIGAIVMIIVIHCRRTKTTSNGNEDNVNSPAPPQIQQNSTSGKTLQPACINPIDETNSGVWSWLSRRSAPLPPQHNLQPVENHYTHMEEPYGSNGGGEALYAELDRESTLERAYQNTAYTDPDAQLSSPPSSAYYSDLSVTSPPPERAYEIVGLATLPVWDNNTNDGVGLRRGRLAAINEAASVPSDYV